MGMVTNMEQLEVTHIPWSEWKYWTPSMECSSYYGTTSHFLVELGGTTANYRYSAYYKRCVLVSRVIRLDCCTKLKKCPIKHYTLPLSPCRKALRMNAQDAAYRVWVEFLSSIARDTQSEGKI